MLSARCSAVPAHVSSSHCTRPPAPANSPVGWVWLLVRLTTIWQCCETQVCSVVLDRGGPSYTGGPRWEMSLCQARRLTANRSCSCSCLQQMKSLSRNLDLKAMRGFDGPALLPYPRSAGRAAADRSPAEGESSSGSGSRRTAPRLPVGCSWRGWEGGAGPLSSSDLRNHCGRPASAARRKTSPRVGNRVGTRSARTSRACRSSVLSWVSRWLDWPPRQDHGALRQVHQPPHGRTRLLQRPGTVPAASPA